MMPACIRAETGVGVSIVSGSQVWKGNWADLVIAPTANSTAAAPASAPPGVAASRNSAGISSVPKEW